MIIKGFKQSSGNPINFERYITRNIGFVIYI